MKDATIFSKMEIAASQNIKEKDYWLEKLSGELVKRFFPYDHKITDSAERRLDTVSFGFDDELSAKKHHSTNCCPFPPIIRGGVPGPGHTVSGYRHIAGRREKTNFIRF